MSQFLDALHSGRVLLMDGAMGTELQRTGAGEGECYELLNLTHPERVRAIHQSYVAAGARCLLTNTFQSNPRTLTAPGLADKLEEINRTAVDLARSVAVEDGFVLGSVGPIDFPFHTQHMPAFDRVVASLAQCDAILLETWTEVVAPALILQARRAAVNPRGIPVLVSLAFRCRRSRDGQLEFLPALDSVARLAHSCGADALGVNCGKDIGMDEIIEIIHRFRQVTRLPLFARPNAGTPIRVENRWVYPATPEKMAARLPELLEPGVSMVGGCCGTTPDHIAAFRPIVEEWNKRRS